jgi:uncharacterized protein YeaO (DUF488 family)
MAKISLKRAYEAAQPSDGFRVLVDRVWPRGVTKEAAAVDLWLKSVAPSAELRKWFGHKPERWDEFRTRYRAELREHDADLEELVTHADSNHLTLVFGAKDTEHNQAVVLKEVLEERIAR